VNGCAWLSLIVAMGFPAACRATDTMYHFIDERGIGHFSNVPHDPRYRAGWRAAAVMLDAGQTDPPLYLHLSAPEQARKGDTLDVSIALPGSTSVRGQIDLLYDAQALAFAHSSVDAVLLAPGRLRIDVDPGIASVFAADVRFGVRSGAPDSTTLRSAILDLESEARTPVRGVPPPPVSVKLMSARR
jgi:hypothetical protein